MTGSGPLVPVAFAVIVAVRLALFLVPEEKVTKLEMSVADGIKYIISLGSIIPEHLPTAQGLALGERFKPVPAAHD